MDTNRIFRRLETAAGWWSWTVTMKHGGKEDTLTMDAKSAAHAIEQTKQTLTQGIFNPTTRTYSGNMCPNVWIRQYENVAQERRRLDTEIKKGTFKMKAVQDPEGPYFPWHKP